MTGIDALNDYVLPFYEEHGVDVEDDLTDNGRDYCGLPFYHPFRPSQSL
jgi:hypothetical protein